MSEAVIGLLPGLAADVGGTCVLMALLPGLSLCLGQLSEFLLMMSLLEIALKPCSSCCYSSYHTPR